MKLPWTKTVAPKYPQTVVPKYPPQETLTELAARLNAESAQRTLANLNAEMGTTHIDLGAAQRDYGTRWDLHSPELLYVDADIVEMWKRSCGEDTSAWNKSELFQVQIAKTLNRIRDALERRSA